MAKAEVKIPLGPDVRVLKTEINDRGEVIITIESTKEGTRFALQFDVANVEDFQPLNCSSES